MKTRLPPVIICSEPNASGALSVVEVREGSCVLSTGEVLLVPWQKLRSLCEQCCQERCAILIRVWWTPAGFELIELRRVDSRSSTAVSKPRGNNGTSSEGVF